jgi:hypothetical protein
LPVKVIERALQLQRQALQHLPTPFIVSLCQGI